MQHINAKLATSQFVRLDDTKNHFNGRDALPLLLINAPFCTATIALQGAQILTFQPKNEQPWLWLSPLAQFESGKSIRGGIPVCLPWFGVNQQHPEKPKHGFVRNEEWQLASIEETDSLVRLHFTFDYHSGKPDLFHTPFTASLVMELGSNLKLSLNIHNTAISSTEFSWAFHTYFAVDDCRKTRVSGLENRRYLDNTRGLSTQIQTGAIEFLQETDRVYNHITLPQVVHGHQTLHISGHHCPTCIVWNIGEEGSKQLSDISEYYDRYICVERGCAFDDRIILGAGESFSAGMVISREEMVLI